MFDGAIVRATYMTSPSSSSSLLEDLEDQLDVGAPHLLEGCRLGHGVEVLTVRMPGVRVGVQGQGSSKIVKAGEILRDARWMKECQETGLESESGVGARLELAVLPGG